MKNLIFTLILVLSNLVVNSQVITVKVTEYVKYQHPSSVSLYESEKQNILEFVSLCQTNTTYVFDLSSSKMTMINPDSSVWVGDITRIVPEGNVFDIYVGNSLIILSNDVNTGEFVLIMEWKRGLFIEGELSVGKQMDVNIQ